ncbi:MAG TPA: hypothetical protein VI703_03530 [Anaerolineales bacterium]|nr:hypothetical protein [Anaerolineales bacterium]
MTNAVDPFAILLNAIALYTRSIVRIATAKVGMKSKLNSAIDFFYLLVFRSSYWGLFSFLLLISILQNGVWYAPNAPFFLEIAENIYINPFLSNPNAQWQLFSFLGPTIAFLIGANQSLLLFSLMHVVFFLVFFVLFAYYLRLQFPESVARSVLVVFFLTPLPSILLTWVGSPDVFTVLLSTTMILFRKKPVVIFFSAVLMGINHFEQGTAILVLTSIFLLLTEGKATLPYVVSYLLGISLGRMILETHFSSYSFDVTFGRFSYFSEYGISLFIENNLRNPVVLVYSLFQMLGGFLFIYVMLNWRGGNSAPAFVLCCAGAFGLILFTLDQTRVFSTLIFPILLLFLLSSDHQPLADSTKLILNKALAASFALGVLVPRIIVWESSLFASAYLFIVGYFSGAIR